MPELRDAIDEHYVEVGTTCNGQPIYLLRGVDRTAGRRRIVDPVQPIPGSPRSGGMDRSSADADFSEFAAAAHGRLRNTAYLLCGDWERAADHVQEGLIRVYVAWPRLVRRGGELAYARKAVVSAFLDASRKRSSTERPTELDDRATLRRGRRGAASRTGRR